MSCASPDESPKIMFFSFVQREKKKSPTKTHVVEKSEDPEDNSIVISSDEEDAGADDNNFELIFENEFGSESSLPKPIEVEEQLICKVEPEAVQEVTFINEEANKTFPPSNSKRANMDDENDVMQFFKLNADDDDNPILKENHYILFVCPQCGTSFDMQKTWREHIECVHNLHDTNTFNFTQRPNSEFQCNKCQTIITRCTLKTLQQHHFTHMPYKVYKCKLCRYEARSFYMMVSHILLHKDREELAVEVSVKMNGTEMQRSKSLEHECTAYITFICPACGRTFDTEDTWQAHINFTHNFLEKTAENKYEDHFKCSECGVEIFSQHVVDLQLHLFTHLPYKSYLKCKLCSWTVSKRNFLISHLLNLHKMEICPKPINGLVVEPTLSLLTIPVNKSHLSVTTSTPAITSTTTSTGYQKEELTDPRYVPQKSQARIVPFNTLTRSKQKAALVPPPNRANNQTSNAIPSKDIPTPIKRAYSAVQRQNSPYEAKFSCNQCNETFKFKAELRLHSCAKEVDMQCDICFKEYNYEKCFVNHLRRCREKHKLQQRQKTRETL